jgi:MOSC domain-containing protein YiiM
MPAPRGTVVAVHRNAAHGIGKATVPSVRLLAGRGVEGDAHMGATVQHRSRVARDPAQPNLRQVHLVAAELLDELVARGFPVRAGAIGENVTTRGIALADLPAGTRLRLGAHAVVELTGLRNPCRQLDGIAPGLMAAVLEPGADGGVVRRAGVMAVVVAGGEVGPGDHIAAELPREPHLPLAPV